MLTSEVLSNAAMKISFFVEEVFMSLFFLFKIVLKFRCLYTVDFFEPFLAIGLFYTILVHLSTDEALISYVSHESILISFGFRKVHFKIRSAQMS